jgi:UDP-2-acetamido-3-amino-2,3-dideoxy-glucuronate N-acetyltransferase
MVSSITQPADRSAAVATDVFEPTARRSNGSDACSRPMGADPTALADAARKAFVHPTAIVEDGASVGAGTRIWHRGHIRTGSRIGVDCTVGFAVYVDTEVVIGDRCKIQNHVSLFRGVALDDDVFVGPSVVFTNDLYPRASSLDWELRATYVHRGASIGANATIVCGIHIGDWSMVAAGAVVTADVPAYGLVVGAPARLRGWVCACGAPLASLSQVLPLHCPRCGRVPDAPGDP